jgi:hypothetical protein
MVVLVRPTLRETALACGVHRNTALRWCRRHEGFREAMRLERFNEEARQAIARFGRFCERWCL